MFCLGSFYKCIEINLAGEVRLQAPHTQAHDQDRLERSRAPSRIKKTFCFNFSQIYEAQIYYLTRL